MGLKKDNTWRDYYNPLRGISLARVVELLEAGERGTYSDLQWFYYYMERTDGMIFAIIQRRLAALLDSDWDIRVGSGGRRKQEAAGFDAVLAEEQAACLREVYDGIDNLREATSFLFTGFFRGYAHLEKHFTDAGLAHLEPVEQWFWVREGMFGEWQYNENAVSGRRSGTAVDRDDFVIHEATALNRMLALLFLRRTLNKKDWDGYLEVFGIPAIFLVGPPGVSEDQKAEWTALAEEITANGRGFLPNGSDIKNVTGAGGGIPGQAPFITHLEAIDKEIALVGTGGLLTMLAESGSGTLAGNAHADSFDQIARGDSAQLSEVFQRDVDRAVLGQAFPGQPVLAYFEFARPAGGEAVRGVVADAVTLSGAGYKMDVAELSEKTGYNLAEAVAVVDPLAVLPADDGSGVEDEAV